MAQIRVIKKRMVAVGTIQRITKTMQMIATSKFTKALQRARATQPYAEKIRELTGEVIASAGDADHPLIKGPSDRQKRELLLVITSDRGLCGAYNANILRASLKYLRRLKRNQIACDIHTAGKKAVGFFRFQKLDIAERYTIGDTPQYDEVERIAQTYIDVFIEGGYDKISVAFMKFISNARQVPEVMQVLPLAASEDADTNKAQAGGPTCEFSPSSDKLLASLLPQAVKSSVFQAFNDASVSEQIMRMIAMKAATDNAKGLGKSLKRDYNRARQAQITTELMEVISGAAALE